MERTQLIVYNSVLIGLSAKRNQGEGFTNFICLNFINQMKCYSRAKQFLIFNVTGDRNANDMLDVINSRIQFDQALFTPNISSLCCQDKGK